jgi:predicted nucleic acid-binding protein
MPDTDCIIAAVSAWHVHHEPAQRHINQRLAAGESLVTACHALTEAYSVLTRLPLPQRRSGQESWRVLDESFVRLAEEVVALTARQYLGLLEGSPQRPVVGGYHLRCADR